MNKSKNSEQKINLNHDNYNNQQNKMNEKEVINELIIELKISDKEKKKKLIFYVIKIN